MKPLYCIERWEHGLVICAVPPDDGVPFDALNEVVAMAPKGAIIDCGIAHHLKASKRSRAIICVATDADAEQWRAEIQKSLIGMPRQQQWWWGLDVGSSSTSIFAVFCDQQFKHELPRCGSTPSDSDDFGRCKRLLDLFPEWRANLHKVAEAYPKTCWPGIVKRWPELEAATNEQQYAILKEIE